MGFRILNHEFLDVKLLVSWSDIVGGHHSSAFYEESFGIRSTSAQECKDEQNEDSEYQSQSYGEAELEGGWELREVLHGELQAHTDAELKEEDIEEA